MDETVLDNPAWCSLTSGHAHLAIGGKLARRYPANLAPVAALAGPDPPAFGELTSLVGANETVFMLGLEPPLPSPWKVKRQVLMVQMVCHAPVRLKLPEVEILQLTGHDVSDMLALTRMTEVGPFREGTYQLGTYLGVRVDGELVSMAGEFLHPGRYRELHVVCTHPDHRGRGYASQLVRRLVNSNLERSLVPFLLTAEQNVGAQSLYERLGFIVRRQIPLIAAQKRSGGDDGPLGF